MSYNSKSIIKDVNGKPVPQYFNKESDRYEVIESKLNMLRVILYDSSGNELQTQTLINQLLGKLDEIIEAVT